MSEYDVEFEGKIIIPKIIGKFPKRKNNKLKKYLKNHNVYNVNNNSNKLKKEFNLKNISIDEINNDFLLLASNEDEEKCFDEINRILFNYNEKESIKSKINKISNKKNIIQKFIDSYA